VGNCRDILIKPLPGRVSLHPFQVLEKCWRMLAIESYMNFVYLSAILVLLWLLSSYFAFNGWLQTLLDLLSPTETKLWGKVSSLVPHYSAKLRLTKHLDEGKAFDESIELRLYNSGKKKKVWNLVGDGRSSYRYSSGTEQNIISHCNIKNTWKKKSGFIFLVYFVNETEIGPSIHASISLVVVNAS